MSDSCDGCKREAAVACHFRERCDEAHTISTTYSITNAQKRGLPWQQADVLKIMLRKDKYDNFDSYIGKYLEQSGLGVFRIRSE